jgi:SAM-dependent methyltransferase
MGSAVRQGELWGASARAWSELNEPHCAPLYEAVLNAIDARSGLSLLDAGCGAGLAMQLAAKRGATVTGLDASAALLEIARERNPEAELRQGDLEALPFGDTQFDAITAFNSVQYAADHVAAVRELRRVAKPGASVAVLAWGRADQCETSVILGALGGLMPPPPPGAPAGGPFALAEPGALEALVESGGLKAESAADAPMAFEFPDLQTAVAAQLTSGPARVAIEHSGEEAVRTALATAYAGNRQADGTYRQANIFRFVIARR